MILGTNALSAFVDGEPGVVNPLPNIACPS
jgi:hypothetical protein